MSSILNMGLQLQNYHENGWKIRKRENSVIATFTNLLPAQYLEIGPFAYLLLLIQHLSDSPS